MTAKSHKNPFNQYLMAQKGELSNERKWNLRLKLLWSNEFRNKNKVDKMF